MLLNIDFFIILGEQLLQTEKNGARTTVLAPLCLQSALITTVISGFHVRERIRTPDTLVRSQVLYPAELHVQRKYYNSAAVTKSQALFLFFYIFMIEAPIPVLGRNKC